MTSPNKTVHRVHFEDFDGRQFERLVFAYLVRAETWKSIEWFGQIGSDLGRDILATRSLGNTSQIVCIQCANRKALPTTKVIRDINKCLSCPTGKPDVFRLICTCPVSAKSRDKIKKYAAINGIGDCEIWSGEEFEERLRATDESLLMRYMNGEAFPDTSPELKRFAQKSAQIDDKEILGLISRIFDRPAFHTPFHDESSLPAFKQAINDTIQALNTGIWQTRDGKEIERFPSRHSIKSPQIKLELEDIERKLVGLRSRFDQLIKDKEIKPCACDQPDCPVYFFSPTATWEMDALRSQILSKVSQIYPQFSRKVGW